MNGRLEPRDRELAVSLRDYLEQRYHSLQHLGEGGYGAVYRGIQTSTGQAVAIKIMRDMAATGEDGAARFRRELACCARINHPNVVRIIDAHEAPQGDRIAVFELVPGLTLAAALRGFPRPTATDIKPLMLDLLDGLSAIHGAGILHRDLKPANIMINEKGATERAIILDLGVGAFFGSQSHDAASDLTRSGTLLGTPSYAAPEQLRGHATVRSDLFSFGLVLLESLADNDQAARLTAAEVIAQRLSAMPVPLPAWLLDHPLGGLLRQLLSKDVAERPTSARETHRLLSHIDFGTLPRISSTREAPRGRAPDSTPISVTLAGHINNRVRRPLTVLVAELVDHAHRSSSECDRLEQFVRKVASRVGVRHQACVEMATGRQLVATFGFPNASEHDSLHAAYAALAILAACREFSPQPASADAEPLTAAIGIHIDTDVVHEWGSDSRMILGEVRAHAQCLALAAQPGEVLLSDQVVQALGGRFDLGDAHAVQFGARTLFAVCLLGPKKSRDDKESTRRTLVGRDREMSRLSALWSEVRKDHGQMVLITGEPGIGKTRLVAGMHEWLKCGQNAEWLSARCDPEAGFRPLHPMQCLVADETSACASETDDRHEQLQRHLAQRKLEPWLPEIAWFLQVASVGDAARRTTVPAPTVSQQAVSQQALFAALVRWVQSYATCIPTVLVVEDLHWADATTLQWLSELLQASRDLPLLVLGTTRPQLVGTSAGIEGAASEVLRLKRLSRQASTLLLHDVVGRALAPELTETAIERCDGIPLFIEEVGRELALHGSDDGRGPLGLQLLPRSLRPLLVSHLDRMGTARRTAQLASVAGQEISRHLLGEVSNLRPDDLDRDLATLIEGGILVDASNHLATRYRFRHALIREAAYETMLGRDLAIHHAHFAQVLESRVRDEAASRPDLVAHHHEHAGNPEGAAHWHHAALVLSLERSANIEAIRHGERALGALARLAPSAARQQMELDIWGQLSGALSAVLGYGDPRVGEALERIQDLARRLDRTDRLYPALTSQVMYHVVRNEWQLSVQAAESWHTQARTLADPGPRAAAAQMLGHQCFIAGRLQDAERYLREACELYDPRYHRRHAFEYGADTRAMALAVASSVAWFLGDEALAAHRAQEALTWSEELGHGHTRGSVLFGLACAQHYARNRTRVLGIIEALDSLAHQCDIPMVVRYGKLLGAWASADLPAARRALVALEDTGLRSTLSYWASLVAELELELGALDHCERRLESCLTASGTTDGPFYRPELLRMRASLHLSRGDAQTALNDLEQAIGLAHAQGAVALERRSLADREHVLTTTRNHARNTNNQPTEN